MDKAESLICLSSLIALQFDDQTVGYTPSQPNWRGSVAEGHRIEHDVRCSREVMIGVSIPGRRLSLEGTW